ncbi:MAG: baseplate J/gp47 family protein [Cytophagaceae bacterium]|nr:baseplate J/gp47 family protein [Cytophagaceae bacterium]
MNPIPTSKQLYDSILADLNAAFTINIPFFGKSFLRALAGVQAGKLKLFYLLLGKLQKNIFVDTADPESSGGTLERFGRVKINRDPFNARAGQYTASVTGTVGGTIDASTTFKSDDSSLNPGKLFILDTPYTLVSSPDFITLRALTSGTNGKLNIGDTLTVTAPVPNVNKIATVTAVVIEPLEGEGIEEYRGKVVLSYRLEPQGGAGTDYRLWSQDAQGVKQTYAYAKSGVKNEINLFVEAEISDSTDGKGTPSAGLLADVESDIEMNPDTDLPEEERGRRPLGIFQIHYLPVTIKQVDININGFSGLTTDIQTAILSSIKSLTDDIRPFVSSVDILSNKNDILDVNRIVAAILSARPGAVFGTVTMKIDGVTMSTFQFLYGDIPYLNTVTYV